MGGDTSWLAAVLRRLAGYRGDPIVSSVYLDVHGAHRPAPDTCEHAFDRLAAELRRRAERRDDPAAAASVASDIDAMRHRLAAGIDRSTTRGVAFFACSADDLFEAVALPVTVADEATLGPTPRIRPLVCALGALPRLLVGLVDRGRLRLLLVEGPSVEELPTVLTPIERAADTDVELGSFEPRQEEAARAHARRAAEELEATARRSAGIRILLGGPEERLAELERHLGPATRALVAGRLDVPVAAPARDVAIAARGIAEAEERRRQAALVDQAREASAAGGQAVVGLAATLRALEERRVATLLVADGFAAPGSLCPACGHAAVEVTVCPGCGLVGPDLERCPVCGARNTGVDDIVETAVEQAVAQDATVVCCHGTGLDRVGGVAALTRFAAPH